MQFCNPVWYKDGQCRVVSDSSCPILPLIPARQEFGSVAASASHCLMKWLIMKASSKGFSHIFGKFPKTVSMLDLRKIGRILITVSGQIPKWHSGSFETDLATDTSCISDRKTFLTGEICCMIYSLEIFGCKHSKTLWSHWGRWMIPYSIVVAIILTFCCGYLKLISAWTHVRASIIWLCQFLSFVRPWNLSGSPMNTTCCSTIAVALQMPLAKSYLDSRR